MLSKVQSGDPLRIPAATFNAFVDAARDHQARQREVGQTPGRAVRQAGIVLVRNDSGADADRCTPLGLAGPVVGPTDNADEFKSRLCLSAEALAAGHRGRFCVLLEPLAAGAIGLAWASGLCPAQVDISDGRHGCADVSSAGALTSGPAGSARILWKAAETGSGVWCVLRLGVGGEGTADTPAEMDGSGASADTQTWDAANPPADTDGVTVQPARLYWSGVAGDPVKLFTRTTTFDSAGRLVAVAAETEHAIDTGDCNT